MVSKITQLPHCVSYEKILKVPKFPEFEIHKILQNGQFGSQIKNAKKVVVCRKPLQKTTSIRKMRAF